MSDKPWTATDMPVLDGRTVVVTGANSGVGLATARGFARAGAHVVLAVRDTRRGREAAAAVRGSNEVRELDLADQASVHDFARSWQGRLDILVNNAGVAMVPAGTTTDGFETHFGTNHLGHFALTNLLLPHVTDRVVTLASGAHRAGTLRFDDLNLHSGYGLMKAYGQSKLANLLFTLDLQRRLAHRGSPVRAMAAHPGYAASNLGTQGRNRVLAAAAHAASAVFGQNTAMGALPSLYAATQDLPGASYVGPDGRFEMHGHPTLIGRSAEASDVRVAERLWRASEELTGVPFGLA